MQFAKLLNFCLTYGFHTPLLLHCCSTHAPRMHLDRSFAAWFRLFCRTHIILLLSKPLLNLDGTSLVPRIPRRQRGPIEDPMRRNRGHSEEKLPFAPGFRGARPSFPGTPSHFQPVRLQLTVNLCYRPVKSSLNISFHKSAGTEICSCTISQLPLIFR